MYVTGVGNVAKKKRRGEVNIPSEDWDLVYRTLSARATCSSTVQLPFIICGILHFYIYLSGIVTTEPCPFSSLTKSPLQFPPKSSLTSLLTDVE